MATEQEQLETEANDEVSMGGGSTDFPTVQEVDQSDIPHHPAADPEKETPNQADQPGVE
jgi:molecular chaperone DnaK (HSP70)